LGAFDPNIIFFIKHIFLDFIMSLSAQRD